MTIHLGETIGRYQVLEVLGEGGMATVYRALDTILERDVALKLIRRDVFSPAIVETVFRRFEREARVLARLSHPNIVKVHDIGGYAGDPFLVMECIPGGTLKSRLGRPVHPAETGRLLAPVARALDYAHNLNIVHRDVKPSNILLTVTGEPMLSDFGIAKILDANQASTLTGTGVGLGTPEYMAPEQGLGKDVDGRADVYALGIVMYELLTGHKPFQADTPMETVFKHLTTPLPSARQYVPGLPEAVEKVLIRALGKQPDDRYASMSEFARVLEELAAGKAVTLPAAPPKGKPAPKPKVKAQPPVSVAPPSAFEKTTDLLYPPEDQALAGGAPGTPGGGSSVPGARHDPVTRGPLTPPAGWRQGGIPVGWGLWRRLTRGLPASAGWAVMGIAVIALLVFGGLKAFLISPTPTPTSTPADTLEPTATPTHTGTSTPRPSATASATAKPSESVTPTLSETQTQTATPTRTKKVYLPTFTPTRDQVKPPAQPPGLPDTATPVPPDTATPVPPDTATPAPPDTATPVPPDTATSAPPAADTPTPLS